jgi:hypothetical protein
MAKLDYKELVAQAEKAVSSVSDPSLKQIAFQKVLDDLLNSTQETEDTTVGYFSSSETLCYKAT